MDWIESWFGVSPDGGDGSLERLILLTAVIVGIALAFSVKHCGRRAIARLIKTLGAYRENDFFTS